MRILALDLGRRMGVADGDSAGLGKVPPRVETVIVRGTSIEERTRYLSRWLDVHLRLLDENYDLIITEAPMNPAASKSDNSTIDQLAYYFCLHGVAALPGKGIGIPVVAAPVMSVRKHFAGMAHAPGVRGRKRTSAEARAARTIINEAVAARAVQLGYLSRGSADWDQANACALWDYACAKYARIPAELVLGALP